MKSQERHQLQTNYLADQTGQAISTIKPMATWIVAGLVALLVCILGYAYFKGQSDRNTAEAWTEFYFNQDDPEALVQVYEDYSSTSAAALARQVEADDHLANATTTWYLDLEQARELCNDAIDGYQAVLASSRDALLRSRATLGLAQAYETMGDRDQAIQQYEAVLDLDPSNKALADLVNARLEFLNSAEGEKFFVWFNEDFNVSNESLNISGDLDELPSNPDLQIPTIPEAIPTNSEADEGGSDVAPALEPPPAGVMPEGSETVPAVSDPLTPPPAGTQLSPVESGNGLETPPGPVEQVDQDDQ